jgi:hypothetical protein
MTRPCRTLLLHADDSALVIAPRSLTGAETALILLGETVFGPFWVWAAYGDTPDVWTLAGGALLLVTLVGHEVAALFTTPDAGSTPAMPPPELSLRSRANSADGLGAPLYLHTIGAHRSPLGERFRFDDGAASSAASSRLSSFDMDTKNQPLLGR